MEFWQYPTMMLAGAVAGVLGGLLGVGGAVIMIPAMVWILHWPNAMHQYQAAAMIVVPLLVLPSIPVHRRNRAIWSDLLAWMVPPALLGTAGGVLLSYRPMLSGDNTIYMNYLMGAFFAYVAGQNILKLLDGQKHEGLDHQAVLAFPWWRKGAVGMLMGIAAGLLSVGGGAVAVPAQQSILRMPLRNAIATSAAAILFTGLVGAVMKNAMLGPNGQWQTSLLLAGLLTPTAMLGSYIGSHLTHKLPLMWVRLAFIIMLLASAARLFVR